MGHVCMSTARAAVTASCLLGVRLSAQTEPARITAGSDVQVSRSWGAQHFAEVTVCADPADPKQLVAAAMYDTSAGPTGQRDGGVVAFSSHDGGMSWRATLDTRRAGQQSPDPSCSFGPNGAAFLSTMTVTRQRGAVALYASHDGGSTWSPPTMLGSSLLDRPWLTVDNSTSRYRGQVYVSAFLDARQPAVRDFVLLTTSDSLVEHGSVEQRSHYMHNGPLVTLSDGSVVGLVAHPTTRAQESPQLAEPAGGWPSSPVISAVRSTDGGRTLSPPVVVSTLVSQPPDKRFLLTDFIPSLAVDGGSALFRDRLYAVWIDVESGSTLVMCSFSADSGRTWSPARVVSDDAQPRTGNRPMDSVNPSVAVNKDGVVGVLWYDRRDNPDFGYWPRFAASLDGGETWIHSIRVSREPMVARLDGLFAYSAPRSIDGAAHHELVFSVHNGWNFKAGDTSGLAADANGVFHPVWIDNRTGFAQVWSAPVRVDGTVHRLRDVTAATTLRLGAPHFDAARRVVSVDATIDVTAPLRGPIVVQITSMTSGITDRVSALDTFNGVAGPGAAWVLLGDGAEVAPGHPVSTTFHFALGPWTSAAINPLAVTMRVLAAAPR